MRKIPGSSRLHNFNVCILKPGSLVPRPEEEKKGLGFSHLPLPPHTIDILLYTCDANIDTKCYTVSKFTIADKACNKTHSIVLNPAADLKLKQVSASSLEVG